MSTGQIIINFFRLTEEKQLVASLLSGTFKPPAVKKNIPHIRGISEPAYTQSTWEKTTTWPRAGNLSGLIGTVGAGGWL